MFRKTLTLIVLFVSTLSVNAATLVTNNDILVGIDRLLIGSEHYDVRFYEATYAINYSVRQPLFLGNEDGALDASNAIIEAVNADSRITWRSGRVSGCEYSNRCQIHTPYRFNPNYGPGVYYSWAAYVPQPASPAYLYYPGGTEQFLERFDTAYAVYTISQVPVPPASFLFVSALVGLLGKKRLWGS